MDVQGATATLPPVYYAPAPPTITPAPGSAPDVTAGHAVHPVSTIVSAPIPPGAPSEAPAVASSTAGAGATGNDAIGPTPGLATLPAGPPDGSKPQKDLSSTLTAGVAKLYNVPQQDISVSYQIEKDPNEIVTVFTDKQTGKVIVQFPSETLIALAQFFNKLDGGTVVDKKA